MPRKYVTIEYFEYIEIKGSVTVDEFASKFGIPKEQAATWLAKWATKGYLVREKLGPEKRVGRRRGTYRTGSKWWGRLVYGASREDSQ